MNVPTQIQHEEDGKVWVIFPHSLYFMSTSHSLADFIEATWGWMRLWTS